MYTIICLKVFYPPSYEREIFHYQSANADQIQQATENFFWEFFFFNL